MYWNIADRCRRWFGNNESGFYAIGIKAIVCSKSVFAADSSFTILCLSILCVSGSWCIYCRAFQLWQDRNSLIVRGFAIEQRIWYVVCVSGFYGFVTNWNLSGCLLLWDIPDLRRQCFESCERGIYTRGDTALDWLFGGKEAVYIASNIRLLRRTAQNAGIVNSDLIGKLGGRIMLVLIPRRI